MVIVLQSYNGLYMHDYVINKKASLLLRDEF